MENHCTMVYFSLRESKKNKKGLSPIEVSISINNERIYFSTGKFAKPSDWNKQKQKVKGNSHEANLINDFLVEFRNRIYEKEIELMKRGYMVTVHILKDAVLNKVDSLKDRTIMQIINEHNQEKKKLIGNGVAASTYYTFEHSEHLIKEYIKAHYKREDLLLQEINIAFMKGFHTFLLTDKNMAQNTTTKHLKFVKAMINLAVANNYLKYDYVRTYKLEREPVEIDFLDDNELRKIINFDTPIPRFEKTRDFFLFGCFTGLSYIDIKTLEPQHFIKDEEGRIWIKKRRVKTGVLSTIPLLPIAKLILEKYKGSKHLIPIQDPSDINKNLKDIALLCNIDKHITFHTSRHTFASTVTLANNISIEVVAKMLGHTNTRMTSHYAKLVDKCITEQMDKIYDIYD